MVHSHYFYRFQSKTRSVCNAPLKSFGSFFFSKGFNVFLPEVAKTDIQTMDVDSATKHEDAQVSLKETTSPEEPLSVGDALLYLDKVTTLHPFSYTSMFFYQGLICIA